MEDAYLSLVLPEHEGMMTARIVMAASGALLASACALSFLAARAQDAPSGPLEVELEDLRPGLLASYRSLVDANAALPRVEVRPAFTLGHSSIHPRIPPGPFEVIWTGVMLIKDPWPITFDAFVCGEAEVRVDGVAVLAGRGEKESARVSAKEGLKRSPGAYRLTIRFRALADLPARFQLWWRGPTFAREPVPAWHFRHLDADVSAAVKHEQLVERGREAVARYGCARCHAQAFPGAADPPPGPALADLGRRIKRNWLLDWLEDPSKMHPNAHMPALFSDDRQGFIERWVIAERLLVPAERMSVEGRSTAEPPGDHRLGRRKFIELGCATCHLLPDVERAAQPDKYRTALDNLKDRWPADALAGFLANPASRYPDGHMPRLPLSPEAARDIAAYLLLWSKSDWKEATVKPPTALEIHEYYRKRRLNGRDAALVLFSENGCTQCHAGIGPSRPNDVPLVKINEERGCLSGRSGPRFKLDTPTRRALVAYLEVSRQEKHPAPFAGRQRLIEHLGCKRCHARDSELPPPIEAIGSTLGGAWLQEVPFQRTPRLYNPHQKYTRSYLLSAIREGVGGLRPARYSYRMPAFGKDAEAVMQALAEADGDLPAGPEASDSTPADPTLGSLAGPNLAGFQGYACVSCHIWNGRAFSEPDPGAVGTDLTRVAGRIRRDWFHRYLEGPARFNPSTVMPAVFPHGKPATLASILDGDAAKQQEALWSYLALGKKAPAPKPPPPLPIAGPLPGEPILVAQVPMRLPDGKTVESISLLSEAHDLIVYDLGSARMRAAFTGAQILRGVQGRLRWFMAEGTSADIALPSTLPSPEKGNRQRTFQGYDRLVDGVRLRWQEWHSKGNFTVTETLRLPQQGKRRIQREVRFDSKLMEKAERDLPPARTPPPYQQTVLPDPGRSEGPLERPGYRAIAYPRPKTVSGEDRVMPSAVAADPADGRVFVASMKTGELFVLHDPGDDGKKARFDNYAHGLFEEAFSMLGEREGLYVLHRRNLTRITGKNGKAERFERVAELSHGAADTYDYAYGLARDKTGAFVFSYAPYANASLPGAGSALRLTPGQPPREIAFGFRNPVGWCAGPDGEIFFTDNQGEWVATNKLCHVAEGRFYGFPNSAQRQHVKKPVGKAAVWVPYAWARSINGVTYNNTGDKFGPFAGQIFMAELMFGGAIIRANVEKVNGAYQGACFPFWGQGLLGPLTLTFDPKGRLWVGSITEPGWMAQPDRGALFRIDFTGKVPFEIKSMHVLPQGFRLVFTRPVSAKSGQDAKSYRLEHYRYEYTGAYGSPELDRTHVPIERIELAEDRRSVDVTTASLVKDRVYFIQCQDIRSEQGETLVHPAGAYTLNEVPR